MTHPDVDRLAAMLVDSGDVDLATTEHLADCPRCQQILAELADVELLITRYADSQLPAPRPEVWQRIDAATMARAATPAGVISMPSRHISGRRRMLSAAAAAALILTGVAVGRFTANQSTTPQQLAQVSLRSLDGTRDLGQARLVQADGQTRLVIAPGQVRAPDGGYVEAWLINTDLQRMVSIGVLDPGHDLAVDLPPGLLAQGYRIVDLSNERYDNQPAHSGDSIMRGTLPQ